MKAKITARTDAKPFQGQKGTIYYRDYTLDDGVTINLGSSKEDAPWGQIGQEIEYEEDGVNSKGYKKYKRISASAFGGGGGYKKPTMKPEELSRMIKSNALGVVIGFNKIHNEEILKGTALAVIEDFTWGNLSRTTELEKFSNEEGLFISRMSSVKLALEKASFDASIKTEQDLIKTANTLYGYITKV